MKTFQSTIKNLATEINQDYQTTSALVKILVSIGAAKQVGFQAQEAGKRGKPSAIFELDNEFEMVFREDNVPEIENTEKVVDSPVNKE